MRKAVKYLAINRTYLAMWSHRYGLSSGHLPYLNLTQSLHGISSLLRYGLQSGPALSFMASAAQIHPLTAKESALGLCFLVVSFRGSRAKYVSISGLFLVMGPNLGP